MPAPKEGKEMFSGALKKRSRTVFSQSSVSAMKAEALTLGAQTIIEMKTR
jgi:hypothetical protein